MTTDNYTTLVDNKGNEVKIIKPGIVEAFLLDEAMTITSSCRITDNGKLVAQWNAGDKVKSLGQLKEIARPKSKKVPKKTQIKETVSKLTKG